jgi:hypothetical protein
MSKARGGGIEFLILEFEKSDDPHVLFSTNLLGRLEFAPAVDCRARAKGLAAAN